MYINSLCEDSLLAIFGQVTSLKALLTSIPLVCRQWSQLQPIACRRRRWLTIVLTPHRPAVRNPKKLFPTALARSYVDALVSTFPCISRLLIFHDFTAADQLEELLYLLEQWAPELTGLELHSPAVRRQHAEQVQAILGRLFGLLDSCPRLAKLHLKLSASLPPIELPLLGRLADVKLMCPNSEAIIMAQLLKHCPTVGGPLRRLELSLNSANFVHSIGLLSQPHIASKIYQLQLDVDTAQLAFTLAHCPNISWLTVRTPLDTFCERLQHLVQCTQLTDLQLHINHPPTEANALLPPPLQPVPLPVLPQVRILRLTGTIPSHVHFAEITRLDQTFPNLRKVHLRLTSDATPVCTECRQNGRDWNACVVGMLQAVARIGSMQQVLVVASGTQLPCGFTGYSFLPQLKSSLNE